MDESRSQHALERQVVASCEERLGRSPSRIDAITGSLGLRHFFRLHFDDDPTTVIARVEAPEDPATRPTGVAPEPPLEPIRRLLEEHGIPVPRQLASDRVAGIEFLEDGGAINLQQVAETLSPSVRRALYTQACEIIVRLQGIRSEEAAPSTSRAPVAAFERRLDAALFALKAHEVKQRVLPWALGRDPSAVECNVVDAAFSHVAKVAASAPQRLSHRDFKAANLQLHPPPTAASQLTVIDLQGAFIAPPEYDLVCLLHDCQVQLPDREIKDLLSAVGPRLPEAPAADEFELRFHLLTLTRVGKDLGRFIDAIQTRGLSEYASWLPRGAELLLRSAEWVATRQPQLREFAELLQPLRQADVTAILQADPRASDEHRLHQPTRKSENDATGHRSADTPAPRSASSKARSSHSAPLRAMILAAGQGTRMHPLTELRPKPAVPIRGIPIVGYLLGLLAKCGVRDVILNLHHLPEVLEDAIERHTPPGLRVETTLEDELLGTGGGIRNARDFLSQSETSIVLAGDMLFDYDLQGFAERHREQGNLATLLLREDPREKLFGTIGFDSQGVPCRLGKDSIGAGETGRGVFVGVRAFSSRIFDSLPERDSFEDLRDWLGPLITNGNHKIRAELAPVDNCVWEPVGTLAEYLRANLHPPALDIQLSESDSSSASFSDELGLILGSGARLGHDARLERAVVWDDEVVPDGFVASDGVFAGGRFHPVEPIDDAVPSNHGGVE